MAVKALLHYALEVPDQSVGQRYYRDCWWDWGQRRCELKPWF